MLRPEARFILLAPLLLVLLAGSLSGQAVGRAGPAEPDARATEEDDGWWRGLVGVPEPDRLYGGLWALHLRRVEDGLSAHHLLGVTWRGLYAGTFVNTHEGRSWTVAFARSVIVAESGGRTAFTMGYRLGLLGGYDERLLGVAGRWPVIPAGQVVADLRYGRFGMQLSWAWVVTTIGGFVAL